MNRYLEKIAEMSIADAATHATEEYERLLKTHGARDVTTGNVLSKRYWTAVRSGGHGMSWRIQKKPGGGFDESYEAIHATPNVLTRYLSPIYGVIQNKQDVSLVNSVSKLHEAIELDEFRNHVLPILKRHFGEGPPPDIDRGFMVSGHMNPAVVMRESNFVNRLGAHEALSRLAKYRRTYDDPTLLAITGKRYGEVFSEEEMDKARTYYDKPVTSKS